jgi:hypothetical protein
MLKANTLAAAALFTLAGSLAGSAAFAQASAPSTTAPSMTAPGSSSKTTMAPDTKKAKSAECSKEADAKGLHGAARKKFRSECKKG